MKKIMLTAIAACLLCGCVNPPANQFAITNPRWKLEVKNPKNFTSKDFEATIDTNGTVRIKWGSISSTNDPQVVSKTAAGQALQIREMGQAITSGITNGINAFKASQGAP
jgi:hypothetical protein